jgi:DNA-binding NarL/FixJ family response regulator
MQLPSNLPTVAASGTASVNSPKQAAATPESKKGDTVELSSHAKAKLLKQNGASNSSIAAQLGVDIKTVNGYFSTQTAKATVPKPNSPAPEAITTTTVKA